jgi:subtilisin family serine protease
MHIGANLKSFIAILDSGINIDQPIFLNKDGSSRVFAFWDQVAGDIVLYNNDINSYLKNNFFISDSNINSQISYFSTYNLQIADLKGHGSQVAEIALKSYLKQINEEDAEVCNLIIVRLAAGTSSKTSSIMRAADFCVKLAEENNAYLVINLSYGSNDGSHDGSSLLERYFDELCENHKINIVIASGNERGTGHHARILPKNFKTDKSEPESNNISTSDCDFLVNDFEQQLYLAIYYSFYDKLSFTITNPAGLSCKIEDGFDIIVLGSDRIATCKNGISPFGKSNEIKLVWVGNTSVTGGKWKISCQADNRLPIMPIDLWLPTSDGLIGDCKFINSDDDISLTIPSSAENVITVGAASKNLLLPTGFSGCGFTRDFRVKPDICAPGEDIVTDSLATVSGTSYSAPYVAGLCAALYEKANSFNYDPWLYGNRMKSLLINLSHGLPSQEIPSKEIGWGVI